MFKHFSLFAKEETTFEQNDNDNGNDSVFWFFSVYFRVKVLRATKFNIRSSNKLSVDYSTYYSNIAYGYFDENLLFSMLSILIYYMYSFNGIIGEKQCFGSYFG